MPIASACSRRLPEIARACLRSRGPRSPPWLIVLSFITKASADFSRVWSFLWFLSALGLMIVLRSGTAHDPPLAAARPAQPERRRARRRAGRRASGAAPHGDSERAVRLVGVYCDVDGERAADCAGQRVVGDIDALVRGRAPAADRHGRARPALVRRGAHSRRDRPPAHPAARCQPVPATASASSSAAVRSAIWPISRRSASSTSRSRAGNM